MHKARSKAPASSWVILSVRVLFRRLPCSSGDLERTLVPRTTLLNLYLGFGFWAFGVLLGVGCFGFGVLDPFLVASCTNTASPVEQ